MTNKSARSKEPNAIQRWYRETAGELRRVSWPTREEALHLTWIVIIVMFASGALLGTLDGLFERFFLTFLGG